VSLIILRTTRSRAWALGFLVGHWAHAVTDINDTVGTMLFFPFSTETISTGMWRYGAYLGGELDGAAYYSGAGGIWDMTWFVIVLLAARVTLTKEYFRTVVRPADPGVWRWLEQNAHIGERGLVALYRGWLFYAGCRITAWTFYARFRVHDPWDVRWGGPYFVGRSDLSPGPWWPAFRSAAVGAVLVAVALSLIWRLCARHWWESAAVGVVVGAERIDAPAGQVGPVRGHAIEEGGLLGMAIGRRTAGVHAKRAVVRLPNEPFVDGFPPS
jgi:hypothetical protein